MTPSDYPLEFVTGAELLRRQRRSREEAESLEDEYAEAMSLGGQSW